MIRIKVLGLASYPKEAAATRYRLLQYVEPLAERGIELVVRPFLGSRHFASLYRREAPWKTAATLARSSLGRLGDVVSSRRFDALLVQREAMILGPPLIEWMMTRLGGCPMVLDLDDPTYLPYLSPTYGRLGTLLKSPGKTDRLIRWANAVTCGSPAVADYASSLGALTTIIPTVVDTDQFCPSQRSEGPRPPVIGWVGSHSTFPYLQSVFPVLQRLAAGHKFRLKVVGAGRSEIDLPGMDVELMDWDLGREVSDFQSIDIGLYPIADDAWAAGKSGFKAIQYMAVGVPFVVSPVGVCAGIGEPGVTHLAAVSPDGWYDALSRLLENEGLRATMGAAGRGHALAHYTVPQQAVKLANVLRAAVKTHAPG